MRAPATNSMFRSAKVSSSASEVAGEGGIGLGSGIRKVISQCCRTPREETRSWSISAASLGAGGQARGRVDVVIGSEGDHQDVGLVLACVGSNGLGLRVDRGDRLVNEPHA